MHFEMNRRALCADIRGISAQIRELKAALRSTWQRPMAAEQRELCRLKQRATELYALSAFSRGKLHVRHAPHGAPTPFDPLQYHARIAERLAPSYSLVLEQSA